MRTMIVPTLLAASCLVWTTGEAAPTKAPLALTLRTTKVDTANPRSTGIGLELWIQNKSKRPLRFFRDDGMWHSSALELSRSSRKGGRAKKVRRFDRRSVASTSAEGAAHKASELVTLAPGKRLRLGAAQLLRGRGGACKLGWGPYTFAKLAPGVYQARAIWRRRTTRFYDTKRRRWGNAKGVWRGKLRSRVVPLHVAGCR